MCSPGPFELPISILTLFDPQPPRTIRGLVWLVAAAYGLYGDIRDSRGRNPAFASSLRRLPLFSQLQSFLLGHGLFSFVLWVSCDFVPLYASRADSFAMPEGALLDRLSSCCGSVVGSNCFVIRFLLLAMMGAGVTGYDAKWLDAS